MVISIIMVFIVVLNVKLITMVLIDYHLMVFIVAMELILFMELVISIVVIVLGNSTLMYASIILVIK